MDTALNAIAKSVRTFMRWPAQFLDRISGGRITPNQVTLVSLLGHFTVIWALWKDRPILGAILLIFFGIMDTLDGALAKLQKRASLKGMLYDAVSDRVKEVLVYVGVMIYLDGGGVYLSNSVSSGIHDWYTNVAFVSPYTIIVAVCGLSLVVSYIKAKGEMALSSTGNYNAQKLNRVFSDGFARYEVRMALIVLGLLTGNLLLILHVLVALLIFTSLQRIFRVSKALGDA